jgi:CRISPR/Cas system-associated exonuclease Cas4 (RecB family)
MSALVEQPLGKKQGRSIAELSATVSASRLQCWQQCRLKFYFRYVLAIAKRTTAALHVGKVVHAVLQAWNMARWKGQAFESEVFHELFEKDWRERQTTSPIRWEDEENEQRDSTWTLLQTYFAETPIKANERPEAVEVPMEADLPDGLPKLVGVIDLVRAGGRIVDFKTSGQTPDAEKVEHLHEVQLSCYSLLYRDATGRKESGLELHHLVKLKTPKVVITPLAPMTESQEARLFRAMESYQEGLSRRDFVPSPGIHCSCCEYFNECRRASGKEGHETIVP